MKIGGLPVTNWMGRLGMLCLTQRIPSLADGTVPVWGRYAAVATERQNVEVRP